MGLHFIRFFISSIAPITYKAHAYIRIQERERENDRDDKKRNNARETHGCLHTPTWISSYSHMNIVTLPHRNQTHSRASASNNKEGLMSYSEKINGHENTKNYGERAMRKEKKRSKQHILRAWHEVHMNHVQTNYAVRYRLMYRMQMQESDWWDKAPGHRRGTLPKHSAHEWID